MRLIDAHNHLQDERLASALPAILETCAAENVMHMVVNGSGEDDWPRVLSLAREHRAVVPSFGCHPWYLQERTPEWREQLVRALDTIPSAVGEIGLDRWKEGFDADAQEEAFVWQLRIAAERGLPVTIHCLQAWGWLFDLLRKTPRPACGFVLHSYGGPAEMVAPLAKLGAYFSFPGYFLHARKLRQREAFTQVPMDRLLVETDAPDQIPPPSHIRHPLHDSSGQTLNHPANLGAIYEGLAQFRGESVEQLAEQVEENFRRIFGGVLGRNEERGAKSE